MQSLPLILCCAVAAALGGCARGASTESGVPRKLAFQSSGRTLTMAYWPPAVSAAGDRSPAGTVSAAGPGRRQAILLLHGGGGPELIENDPNYRQYPEALAAAGYAVYMPYYWGSTAPSEENTPTNFAAWVGAARNALAWINAREGGEGSVGVIGLSLGAYLALALATEEPGLRAVVEFYGGMPEAYAKRMARMPPTLILHGARDILVDVAEAHRLEGLFRAKGVVYAVHIYPEQNHGFMGEDGRDSVRRMVAFLDRYMKSVGNRIQRKGPVGPTGGR